MPGPLEGFRVVDASMVMSGPLAAMLLADQGADVVTIEGPSRKDLLRGEWCRRRGQTAMYANTNRGKRSLVVDLQQERGLEIFRALVATADVMLENFRPGVADRMGIGAEAMRALNPRLVYCSITGYGETGPYAAQRAYDPVLQGLAGYVGIQKNPEVPIPDLVRNALVDKAAAYTAAQAITAALLVRERRGEGQTIRLPMIDAALAFLWPDGGFKHTLLGDGVREGPALYDRYRLTETADGHIVNWTGADNEWHALFRALDLDAFCEDERFATGRARAEHGEELGAILYDEFRKRTTADVLERMRAAEVPGGPVRELDEVIEDPQVVHNEVFYEDEHPVAGRLRQVAPAPRFSGTPTERRPLAPVFGEHTDEILGELGYDEAAIAALREGAVVA